MVSRLCAVGSFVVVTLAGALSEAKDAPQSPHEVTQEASILSPLTKLDEAYQQGKVSRGAHALAELRYIYKNSDFPTEYRMTAGAPIPVKCGFGAASDIHAAFNELNPDEQTLATSLLARPSQQVATASPEGHFLLHYDTSGVESVPVADVDSTGIPDFIEKAGIYLDSAWNYYHVTVGYLLPPSDGVAGGDSTYDIYFLSIASFGATIFDAAGPEPWNDFTSYIQMHNTFLGFPPNQDPDGDQLGALKVTCAHEYYHAVQLAYDGGDDLWLYESGATSQEDALYPETHDNYQYFPFYWNDPDTFLTVNSGFHKYGAFVWPSFLTDNYADSVMRTFWEYSRFYDGMTSFDSALDLYGSSTKDAFQLFALWNFFTGPRFEPGHFADGANYPGAVLSQTLPQAPFSGVAPLIPPDGLGANYLALPTQGSPSGLLKVDFTGSSSVLWRVNVYFEDSSGAYESLQLAPTTGLPSSDMTFTKYNYTDWDTIFVSPLVVSPFLNDNTYTLSASVLPHGDADASGGVNIADVTYLISYIFSGGPEPVYDLLMGDSDCSGRINIGDVTFLIAFVFSGGPAPCAQ